MTTTHASDGASSPLITPLHAFRNVLARFFMYVGEISILTGRSLRYILRGAVDIRDLVQHMSMIGVSSVPITILTTFTSGGVIALYFSSFLIQYGAGNLTGAVVALALSRELAPVLVGVVVTARAGSAIAAELGTMKVTEQIDALRSLAVSPIQYLIVPRLLAALIVLPILCMIGDAAGILGGYLIASWQGVPSASFPNAIRQYLEPHDFTMGMVKTVVFGLIIALVGCHQGLETRGGATGVGRATTNAVVIAIVLIYISDFVMAYFMFGGRLV